MQYYISNIVAFHFIPFCDVFYWFFFLLFFQIYAECANYMTLDKANVILYSKSFDEEEVTSEEEYWYKTKYSVHELPAEWKSRAESEHISILLTFNFISN